MSNIILVENRYISTYHTLFKQFECFDFSTYASLQNDSLQAGLDDYRFDAFCQMLDNTDFSFGNGSVYLIINVELSEQDKADGISLAHHIRLHDWQKNKYLHKKNVKYS